MRLIGRYITQGLTYVEYATLGAGVFLFLSMLIIAFVAVCLRYISHTPLKWEPEILPLMMNWGVFLGVATVTRDNSHIRITFFAEKIFGEKRAPVIWNTLEIILGIIVSGLLAYLSARWVFYTRSIGATAIQEIWYPLWIPRLGVLIGMGLLCTFYIERLVKQIIGWCTPSVAEIGGSEQAGEEADA